MYEWNNLDCSSDDEASAFYLTFGRKHEMFPTGELAFFINGGY